MKTLYIDCSMGAAGDMLTAALLELLPDQEAFLNRLRSLGIPGITVNAEKSMKCGIRGTHFEVSVDGIIEGDDLHKHHHGSMGDIRAIVAGLKIPSTVKLDIMAVYNAIAQAESQVHGVPVEQIHFHEVGSMDAVADITAVCLAMHELDPDQVIASPVHVGSGSVRCAHGILPVPAPATAVLLKGVPVYSGRIRGELCTPTGAALLKHFVTKFGDLPAMKVESIGYGMGKKDFEQANCVRMLFGQTDDPSDEIMELNCNVDDMTGEAIGFAVESLMREGALDVFTTAIGMKKSRPGVMLTILCRLPDTEKMVHLIFKHTTTIGVRKKRCERDVLDRKMETIETPYGQIRRKVSYGYGVKREKYEYDDLADLARKHDISLFETMNYLQKQQE